MPQRFKPFRALGARPRGKLAGTNRIEREYDGCVIHERDAARHVWHQTWVDNSGTLLTLERLLER